VRPEATRVVAALAKWRRVGLAALHLASAVLLMISGVGAPSAADRTPLQQVEERLMCYCGCSDLTVRVCTCGTADAIRREIAEHLTRGETADQVVADFVARYGAQIRSAPTKAGFDLIAWITPFAALILAGAALVAVVRRWGAARTATGQPLSDLSAPGDGPPLGAGDQRALERVRRELREGR